jgi:hypothetical protein
MGMLQNLVLGIGGIAGVVAFSSSQEPPQFAVDAETARERLLYSKRVVNGTGMGSLTVKGSGEDEGRVRISIQRAGNSNSIICLVAVEPAGETGSGAQVDCSEAGQGSGGNLARARRAMAVVVEEHVAASVNETEYDVGAVSDKIISMIFL